MQDQVIREIAGQIVQEQLLSNWMLYALLAAITLISSVAGAFISNYIRRRAETYATKADLDEILRQVRKTTEATEEVRTAISHADWVTKEWKTLRRVKLEELLEHAHGTEHWLDQQRGIWLFQKEGQNNPSPIDKVSQLTALYFPELEKETQALEKAQREAFACIISASQKVNSAGSDLKAREAAFTEMLPQWNFLYPAVLRAIGAVQNKASNIIKEIANA